LIQIPVVGMGDTSFHTILHGLPVGDVDEAMAAAPEFGSSYLQSSTTKAATRAEKVSKTDDLSSIGYPLVQFSRP